MKILFVHGRPDPHPLHRKYGSRVASEFKYVDPWFRWHDRKVFFLLRYVYWFLNSLYFLRYRSAIILTEGLHLTLVLTKLISFGRIKIIILVDDESPYFITSKYYGPASRIINRWGYRQYDGYVCIGEMETALVKEIVGNKAKFISTGFNGVPEASFPSLLNSSFNITSKRIVFIGNGPDGWRMWYKGLDLMLRVFTKLVKRGDDFYFEIAGNWDAQFVKSILDGLDPICRERVIFKGPVKDVSEFLNQSNFYFHVARGEAWGISVVEAMAAGVVPIVSEWTGAKECVAQVSSKLVVPLEEDQILQRIDWLLSLSVEDRNTLSARCKEVSHAYTEAKAVDCFVEKFENILKAI